MKRIDRIESKLKSSTGKSQLPKRLQRRDGRLYGTYLSGEEKELSEEELITLLDADMERSLKRGEVKNTAVYDYDEDREELKAKEGYFRVGKYEVNEDLTDITLVIDRYWG